MHLRLIEDGASKIGARHLSIVDRDPLRSAPVKLASLN